MCRLCVDGTSRPGVGRVRAPGARSGARGDADGRGYRGASPLGPCGPHPRDFFNQRRGPGIYLFPARDSCNAVRAVPVWRMAFMAGPDGARGPSRVCPGGIGQGFWDFAVRRRGYWAVVRVLVPNGWPAGCCVKGRFCWQFRPESPDGAGRCGVFFDMARPLPPEGRCRLPVEGACPGAAPWIGRGALLPNARRLFCEGCPLLSLPIAPGRRAISGGAGQGHMVKYPVPAPKRRRRPGDGTP